MKSRHKYVAGSQDEGLRRRGNSRDRRESEENRKRGSQRILLISTNVSRRSFGLTGFNCTMHMFTSSNASYLDSGINQSLYM